MIRLRLISNISDFATIIETPGWVTLGGGAFFAVDVFFFLGGFLAAVLVLDKLI